MATRQITPTQEELEAPVKGYQLEAVRQELRTMAEILTKIEKNTQGVVTRNEMEKYVEVRITERIAHLVSHKKNIVKLGWVLMSLVIADIVTRVLASINGG